MILTKKGSTKGNLHFLMIVCVILFITRQLVEHLEDNTPSEKAYTVQWNHVSNLSPKELKVQSVYKPEKVKEKTDKPAPQEKVPDSNKPTSTIISTTSEKAEPKSKKTEANSEKNFQHLRLNTLFKNNLDKKAVLVYFSQQENPACRYFNRVVLTNDEVVTFIESNFYPVEIPLNKTLNNTENLFKKAYSRTYPLFVPCLAVTNYEGKKYNEKMGDIDSKTLISFLMKSLRNIEDAKKDAEETVEKTND